MYAMIWIYSIESHHNMNMDFFLNENGYFLLNIDKKAKKYLTTYIIIIRIINQSGMLLYPINWLTQSFQPLQLLSPSTWKPKELHL